MAFFRLHENVVAFLATFLPFLHATSSGVNGWGVEGVCVCKNGRVSASFPNEARAGERHHRVSHTQKGVRSQPSMHS